MSRPDEAGRYSYTRAMLEELADDLEVAPPSEVTATETPAALADGKPRKRSGAYAVTLDSATAETVKP